MLPGSLDANGEGRAARGAEATPIPAAPPGATSYVARCRPAQARRRGLGHESLLDQLAGRAVDRRRRGHRTCVPSSRRTHAPSPHRGLLTERSRHAARATGRESPRPPKPGVRAGGAARRHGTQRRPRRRSRRDDVPHGGLPPGGTSWAPSMPEDLTPVVRSRHTAHPYSRGTAAAGREAPGKRSSTSAPSRRSEGQRDPGMLPVARNCNSLGGRRRPAPPRRRATAPDASSAGACVSGGHGPGLPQVSTRR